MARGDLLYDVSLGWFVGSGYFGLAYIIGIAWYGKIHPLASPIIISLPFLLLLKGADGDLRALRASALASYNTLHGSAKALLPGAPLILLAVIAVALMTLQGASTPPIADDFVRARGAISIWQHFTNDVPLFLCFVGGVWESFVPHLFWFIGGINVFTVQYLVLCTAIFFLLLIFQSLILEKRATTAMYALFLPTALPFFIFHGTVPHFDIIVACCFGLGFFFFLEFTRNGNEKGFHTAIIFFTLTAMAKNHSDILALTGILFLVAALAAYWRRGGRLSTQRTLLFTLSPLIYAALKMSANHHNRIAAALHASTQMEPPLNQASALMTVDQLLPGIRYSLFSSGHFGILFYILGICTVVFSRKIFSRHKWGFALLVTVLASMLAYYLFVFNDLLDQQAQISRALLTPAVATALFLAVLWGDEAGE